jgi:hypothetical protein
MELASVHNPYSLAAQENSSTAANPAGFGYLTVQKSTPAVLAGQHPGFAAKQRPGGISPSQPTPVTTSNQKETTEQGMIITDEDAYNNFAKVLLV